mgnify:FL=1
MPNIREATCLLRSSTPYSQGNFFTTERTAKMKADEHDKLYWRERAHTIKSGPDAGKMFIPAQQFKNSLLDAARFLGMKVKGKGQATYSKHFAAGVLCNDSLVLPVLVSSLEPEIVWCAADGKPGSGTKVQRRFPIVPSWSGTVTFTIADETIDDQTFLEHLRHAGSLIGIGRWRPIKNGSYGRFIVDSCKFVPVGI